MVNKRRLKHIRVPDLGAQSCIIFKKLAKSPREFQGKKNFENQSHDVGSLHVLLKETASLRSSFVIKKQEDKTKNAEMPCHKSKNISLLFYIPTNHLNRRKHLHLYTMLPRDLQNTLWLVGYCLGIL